MGNVDCWNYQMPMPSFPVVNRWCRFPNRPLLWAWRSTTGSAGKGMSLPSTIWTTSNSLWTTWRLLPDLAPKRQERDEVSPLDKEPPVVLECEDKRHEVADLPEQDSREDKTLFTDVFPSSLESLWVPDTRRRFTTLSSWMNWMALLLDLPSTVSSEDEGIVSDIEISHIFICLLFCSRFPSWVQGYHQVQVRRSQDCCGTWGIHRQGYHCPSSCIHQVCPSCHRGCRRKVRSLEALNWRCHRSLKRCSNS